MCVAIGVLFFPVGLNTRWVPLEFGSASWGITFVFFGKRRPMATTLVESPSGRGTSKVRG